MTLVRGPACIYCIDKDKHIAELESTVARQQMEALAALENVEAERDALKAENERLVAALRARTFTDDHP